jgi:hypothetical protein
MLRDTVIPRSPGKYDYAVNLPGGSPTIAYMMSIGVLNAPGTGNSYDILYDRQLSQLSTVGTIVTSEHRRPYDIEVCRRLMLFCCSLVLKTTSFLVRRPDGTPPPWLDRADRAGISSTSRLDLKR